MAKREMPKKKLEEEIVNTIEETVEAETESKVDNAEEAETVESVEAIKIIEKTGTVTAKKLNVRKSPDINGKICCVANSGDKLTVNITESTDEWYKVETSNGITGYCMKTFVKI